MHQIQNLLLFILSGQMVLGWAALIALARSEAIRLLSKSMAVAAVAACTDRAAAAGSVFVIES